MEMYRISVGFASAMLSVRSSSDMLDGHWVQPLVEDKGAGKLR